MSKTVFIYGISWGLCLAITEVVYDIDTKVKTEFIQSDGDSVKHANKYTAVVHYDEDGRDYINRYGVRYYLDEFMRTEKQEG